jgi:hypothetical protein
VLQAVLLGEGGHSSKERKTDKLPFHSANLDSGRKTDQMRKRAGHKN